MPNNPSEKIARPNNESYFINLCIISIDGIKYDGSELRAAITLQVSNVESETCIIMQPTSRSSPTLG